MRRKWWQYSAMWWRCRVVCENVERNTFDILSCWNSAVVENLIFLSIMFIEFWVCVNFYKPFFNVLNSILILTNKYCYWISESSLNFIHENAIKMQFTRFNFSILFFMTLNAMLKVEGINKNFYWKYFQFTWSFLSCTLW